MSTPQSLDELAAQILMVPMSHFQERVPKMIRDYMSQGFGAAMLKAEPEEAKRLEKLFNHLARRSPNAKV